MNDRERIQEIREHLSDKSATWYRYTGDAEFLLSELDRLSSEHTKMREALEWYGDINNYEIFRGTDTMLDFNIRKDQGIRARSVLDSLTPKP